MRGQLVHPACVFALVLASSAFACKRHESAAQTPPPPVAAAESIRHTTGPIKIDGEWDESDWSSRAARGLFHAQNGELARPSSEIRILHDDRDLVVALYAADEDIRTTDAFELGIGTLALRIDSAGAITPPDPAIRVAVDLDEGTRDNPADDDEEWVVELALPLSKLGLRPGDHVQIRAARCDTPKDKIERCGSWSATLKLE